MLHRQGDRERKSVFHRNSGGGILRKTPSSKDEEGEHDEGKKNEEGDAEGVGAGGRQRGGVYGILSVMDYDPHTIHTIIQKIQQQLRCPQCSRKVPIDWQAVQLTGDDFVLLQLRCDACGAYIVLHAVCKGVREGETERDAKLRVLNASSLLMRSDVELEAMREALRKADGSFERMFGGGKSTDIV